MLLYAVKMQLFTVVPQELSMCLLPINNILGGSQVCSREVVLSFKTIAQNFCS